MEVHMDSKNLPDNYRQKDITNLALNHLSVYGFFPTNKDFPLMGQNLITNYDFTNGDLNRTYLNKCDVIKSTFDLACLTGSIFRNTLFSYCSFEQVNFEGSAFEDVNFENISSFESTGFSSCNFYNCKVIKAEFIGSTFTNTLFDNTEFVSVKFKTLSFENVCFRNCTFRNCELWDLNCEFGDFVNVIIEDCVLSFHFFPYVFQNHENPIKIMKNVKVSVPSGETISYKEYREKVLPYLYIFYKQSGAYFAAANLAFQLDEKEEMYQIIENGFRQALMIKDFRMIKQYCKLMEKSQLFTLEERQLLYRRFLNAFPMEDLNSREYHNFVIHMNEVQSLLFENSILPRLKIDLKSNILSCDSNHIGEVISMIYEYIDLICSQEHSAKVSLSRNSPISFNVDLTDYIANLNVMLPIIICSTAITIASVTDKILDIRIKLKQLKQLSSPDDTNTDEEEIIQKVKEHQNKFSKCKVKFEAPVYFINNSNIQLEDKSKKNKKSRKYE